MDKSKGKQASRGDAVRTAAAQAIHAAGGQAQLTRERAQELADEFAGIAVRLRDVLGPPSSDELRALRADLAALEARVAKLEDATARPKRRAPARKPAPKRGAASS